MTTITKSATSPFVTTFTHPGLTATSTATASITPTDAMFKLTTSFKIFVIGQSDAALEPTKSMSKWVTDTAAARKSGTVDASSNVSSFAIVVEVATKAVLNVDVYCSTTGSTQVNTTAAPLTTCTVGQIGNSIGFYIGNGTLTTTVISGFRVAKKTLTNGVASPAAVATFGTIMESSTSSVAVPPTDWKAAANFLATSKITFGTADTCDTAKWDSATACYGVDKPWAYTWLDHVASPSAPGLLKAWHFLAEKNSDTAKNFQIVKDDKINWLYEE